MSLRLARLVYPLAVGLIVLGYYAVPALRPAAVGALGLVSAAAIAYGLVVLRPARWPAWVLIAIAVILLAIGDVIFTVLAEDTPGPVTYPGPPDVFYLATYLPLAVGLLWLGRPQLPSRDWPMLLDTVGLSLAGSLVVWIVLVRPAVMSMHLTGAGKVTAIASWVGYVAVLAASARVVVAWRANLALRLLALAVVSFLLADFFYGRQLISGTWGTGSLIDLGFLAFSILCGASALMPSMRLVASAPYARHQLGPVRLTMVAIALLVAPSALLIEATSGPVTTGVAIAVVSAAVGVVMLLRLALSARAYRRRAVREHAVRMASRALVLATTESEVTAGMTRALDDMLPEDVHSHARLTDLSPEDAHESPQPQLSDADAATGELIVPLPQEPPQRTGDAKPPGAVVFSAPVAELHELGPALYAIADQAASALHRIDLVGRLRIEEREHYFRTLVLTSQDVTLISRHDQISYATPSARVMFGRDVTGESFGRLVHRSPVDGDGPSQWSDGADGIEGYVRRPGSTATVLVNRRDLTHDPTVGGVVTTLRDVTEERNLQRDLAYRATHDPLTGLANAQLFGDELRAEEANWNGGRNQGRAVLFVDLDDFKAVNDAYGHEVGDHLLIEVARRIGACIGPRDLAARLGGDEFAVLLRHLGEVDAARDVAQRIADALVRPAVVDACVVDCQASIGLAYTGEPRSMSALRREADTALYAAKAHGKGRWRQYRRGMAAPTRQHADARRRLEESIKSGQLTVHYQPIIELATGYPVGFEALLRMIGPDGAEAPEQIVSTAEDTGMIGVLGEWVLGQALADIDRLNPPEHRPCYVSVNVSARQLRQPDFADVVRRRLDVTGVDPSLLVLEITENTLIGDDDVRAWALLNDLHDDGVRVAIDDYGTGFASLSYLRQPSVDIVKLDQSFLTDLSPRNRALIESVGAVFARMQLDQVAEGVQDTAHRDALVAAGFRFGQGFLYAEAMPVDEAAAWSRKHGRPR